jgi:hypothetical protein
MDKELDGIGPATRPLEHAVTVIIAVNIMRRSVRQTAVTPLRDGRNSCFGSKHYKLFMTTFTSKALTLHLCHVVSGTMFLVHGLILLGTFW